MHQVYTNKESIILLIYITEGKCTYLILRSHNYNEKLSFYFLKLIVTLQLSKRNDFNLLCNQPIHQLNSNHKCGWRLEKSPLPNFLKAISPFRDVQMYSNEKPIDYHDHRDVPICILFISVLKYIIEKKRKQCNLLLDKVEETLRYSSDCTKDFWFNNSRYPFFI